jgi:TatD DNase family protein
MFIDTHSHLFLPDFEQDRNATIARAKEKEIRKIILPNVDLSTIEDLKRTVASFPGYCIPLMGLHPCSVKENHAKELTQIIDELQKGTYAGIGECGIDLYWDKTFKDAQIEVFTIQIQESLKRQMPLIIHNRNAYKEITDTLKKNWDDKLFGIFHCFTGSENEAREITEMGFHLGIGGVVTFKNSGLDKTLKKLKPENFVLESDAPYLAPVPYRGKRNESAYLPLIAGKIAEIYDLHISEVARISTMNALKVFDLADSIVH